MAEFPILKCPYCGLESAVPDLKGVFKCNCGAICDMTDGPGPAPAIWFPSDENVAESLSPAAKSDLSRFRTLTAALWPYVRHFGLCGADPEAVAIVAELGELIGEKPAGQPESEQVQAIAESVMEAVVRHIEASPHARQWVRSARDKFLEELREMEISPGEPAREAREGGDD